MSSFSPEVVWHAGSSGEPVHLHSKMCRRRCCEILTNRSFLAIYSAIFDCFDDNDGISCEIEDGFTTVAGSKTDATKTSASRTELLIFKRENLGIWIHKEKHCP